MDKVESIVVKTEWVKITGKWFFMLKCPHSECCLDNISLGISIDDWHDMQLCSCPECGGLVTLSF